MATRDKHLDTLSIVKKKTDVPIIKVGFKDPEDRIVVGLVYSPDVVDSQGDFADADTIFKAAVEFMENGGIFNVMHAGRDIEVQAVFNWTTMQDQMIKNRGGRGRKVPAGSWMVGAKISEEEQGLWEDIKDGVFKGFSMEGEAEV